MSYGCAGCHGGVDTEIPEKLPIQLEKLLEKIADLEKEAEDEGDDFWPDEIESDEDKRLYLFAHQGMMVSRRGKIATPRRKDQPQFCGASCHQGVLRHFDSAKLPHLEGDEAKSCVSCHGNHEVANAGLIR